MERISVRISARQWGLAALFGVLQVLPFPIAGPTPLWRTEICWVALLPLLWALLREVRSPLRVWEGALLGYGCGFVWYLGNCYWIYQTMHLYGGLSEPEIQKTAAPGFAEYEKTAAPRIIPVVLLEPRT